MTNKTEPKCRECNFYRYYSQCEEGFRFCKHDDILDIQNKGDYFEGSVKKILASEAMSSPNWCPLRQ